MPTLRLEEVLKEHTITPELAVYVEKLRKKGTTFDKLDADTASDLRAIAEELKVSFFDLFLPTENLYRLKIIEIIENRYSGNLRERLEALQAELPKSKKISLALLGIYATQILPASLLNGSDLRSICKILSVGLEELKELSDTPKQTISVESLLKKLGLTLDELAILLEIPKKFIPWISIAPIKIAEVNPQKGLKIERTNKSAIWFRGIENDSGFLVAEEFASNPLCDLKLLPCPPCCNRR